MSTKRPKSAKGRTRPTSALPEQQARNPSPSKGTVPCSNCGGLQLVTWKGGGYNMTSSRAGEKTDVQHSEGSGNKKDAGRLQDTYVSGLLQQIKLLELEISYLKQHPPGGAQRKESGLTRKESIDQSQGEGVQQYQNELRTLRKDLMDKSSRLESVLAERTQLANRLKSLEERGSDDHGRQLDTIAKLTGRVEQLETDNKVAEERCAATVSQLETQTIISKDREKSLQQFQEEIEAKDERLQTMSQQMDSIKTQLSHKEKQFNELQDKFLQSSVHIMEETVSGLREENRKLQVHLKDRQLAEEADRQLRERLEHAVEKVVGENADLSSTLAETRQKLESEIRVRENRDARMLLDTQEVVVGRERERELKQDLLRLQSELDRERGKLKTANDKMTRDNQAITCLELKMSTQKSRIAELEGSLELVQESTNKVRKQGLIYQERITLATKEVEEKSSECQAMASKLAQTEHRLLDAERRVEALATLQSHRWMEFSKMADSMKELSHNMLAQSKSNTRKAAIRADLDEELDM